MTALSRRTAAIIALLCAAILFVAINILADHTLRTARIDLTKEKLFTLSPGSRDTLAKIDEPITVRFYYSKRLGDEIPSYGLYAQRVREMLEAYAVLARGKLKLEILDPVPYSAVEDRAVAFGLQGVPIDQAGDQVYFGLAATNSTDDQQVIPFFQPERERFLEYDLTKLVHALAFPKKTVVDLITSLPVEGDIMAAMQGRPMQPFAFIDQLRQLDEVRTVGTDLDKIEPDVDVVLLIHPQKLSDKTQFAIDQFVLNGGKALVFVDPNSEIQQSRPSQANPPGSPSDSNLEKLFTAWGLRMVPGMVAGDRSAARKVNAGGFGRVQPVDYVAWLNLKKDALNADDPITADLTQINMATAGVLEPLDGAKTKFEPLIRTSLASMEIPAEKFQGLPDVAGLYNNFKRENKRLTLAARITGEAATAFPDGPPKPPEGQTPEDKDGKPTAGPAEKPEASAAPPKEWLKTAKQPINVVVVADTDLLDDRFWVQSSDFFGQRVAMPSANNGDFVANAVEVLAGGNDLISLRSRGTSARPFEVVQDIQRDADNRYSAQEHDLQEKLKAAEAKIKDLRDDKNGNVVLTSEQTKAIDNFKAEMLQTRQQLRDVQLKLNQEIDRLKARLEFVDIALIPILVGIIAIVLGILRLQRRKRRVTVLS
ncbi:MAG: Gldg family protein [Alphaproteobacteria bacterium]|nr:Gldg family protein [Alphaproteobacteria bacterium]